MHRLAAHAILAGALALLAACSSASTGGGETPTPTLWTFEEFAWNGWINKVSMNSTVGPSIVGKAVLYGGTYGSSVAGQGSNRVYAFEAGTGAVLWSGRLWGWPMGMALTEDGTRLVGADNLTLYAYRTE